MGRSEEYVLVVDDERENLDLVRRTCFGRWNVSTFEDPEEALSFARDHRLSVVISDFRMPKMNGAEFLEALSREDPSVASVLVTAFGELPEVRELSRAKKVTKLLLKPWDVDEFLETVEQAISITKMRRAVQTLKMPLKKDPKTS